MSASGMTRRRFGGLLGAGVAAAYAAPARAAPEGVTREGARPLIREFDNPVDAALARHIAVMKLHAAGLLVRQGGETVYEGADGVVAGLSVEEMSSGVPRRRFRPETPFRVASMSKAVVAHAAVRLAEAGQVDLEADVQPLLGFGLRHPEAPEAPITLAMLLSHTSGVRDPDVYWVAAPGEIASIIGPNCFAPLGGRLMGAYFEYANLNFGLAATALEQSTGMRFDVLARTLVLEPAGIDGGFNWSGVSQAHREAGATLYRRRSPGDWVVQIDGPEVLADTNPSVLAAEDYDLDAYTPGKNGTLFSPQGGLRASLRDLADLAVLHSANPEMTALRWRLNGEASNGLHDGGYFAGTGLGLVHYPADRSPFAGRLPGPVWGHQGEAYGVHGAFWTLPEADVTIVYAALGVPEKPAPPGIHPGLNAYVSPLAELGVSLLG